SRPVVTSPATPTPDIYTLSLHDALPILIAISDGEELKLGNSRLLFIHTPGHAAHHYCIVDYDSNSVFTGDSFGVSYRELDSAKGDRKRTRLNSSHVKISYAVFCLKNKNS